MKISRLRGRLVQGAVNVLLCTSLVFLVTCNDDDDDNDDDGPVIEENNGTVQVTISTTGEALDEDGYTVVLGGRTIQAATNATVTFSDVPVGSYWLTLEGMAVTCDLEPSEREVLVVIRKGIEVFVEFEVTCTPKPIVYSDPYSGVHRMNLAGDRVVFLAYGRDPVWSPDGTMIAFWAEEEGISIMYEDGSEVTVVLDGGHGVTWAPDGESLATILDGQLATFRSDGSDLMQLTTLEGTLANPDWGIDSKIVFAYQPLEGDSGIFSINSDGSNLERLTTGNDRQPVWSSDGSRIAFVRGDLDNSSIFILEIGTDEPVQRSLDGQFEYAPRWAPDDTKLLFVTRFVTECSGWYDIEECLYHQVTIGSPDSPENERIGYLYYEDMSADWRQPE